MNPTFKDIDEAFMPFSEFVKELANIEGMLSETENHKIGFEIEEYKIESPIELDLISTQELKIGSAFPHYHIQTSVMPVFHKIRLHFEKQGS